MDPCSSAKFFDGWREPVPTASARAPVVRACTWLAAVGWRRHGLIGEDEAPVRPVLTARAARHHASAERLPQQLR